MWGILDGDDLRPKRVIQILSGSRSGSSLLRRVLARCPGLVSLDGEEEPYVAVSGSGYGLTSDSDALNRLEHPALFRRLLRTELTAADRWAWRLGLQYRGAALARLLEAPRPDAADPWPRLREYGVAGDYDGCGSTERLPFNGDLVWEMRPFVLPGPARPPEALDGCTLLLKAPYNVYRPGVMEAAFPGAEFSYVRLLRNPGATVNGLIDGWLAPYGFHKHLTPYGWWKFDLPPNWEDFVGSPVAERAAGQWAASYRRVADRPGVTVRFEDFLADPIGETARVCAALDLEAPRPAPLPVTMATERPAPGRWRRRGAEVLDALRPYRRLIDELGYADEAGWE